MSTIIERYFPDARVGRASTPAPRYRLTTRHGRLFGGDDRYVLSSDAVLASIADFVSEEQARVR